MSEGLILRETHHLWELRVSNLYQGESGVLNWLTFLPPGVGTKHQRSYLKKSTKQFLRAVIHRGPIKGTGNLGHATVVVMFGMLKVLARWMIKNGLWRYSEITPDHVLEYLATKKSRDASGVPATRSILDHVMILRKMWWHRSEHVGSLRFDPEIIELEIQSVVPGRDLIPYSPVDEAAAIALIKDAIDWVRTHGAYLTACSKKIWDEQSKEVGSTKSEKERRLKKIYSQFRDHDEFQKIQAELGMEGSHVHAVLTHAVSVTQGAAIIVLLFMVGLRVKELTRLDDDCVQWRRPETGEAISYLSGVAAKKAGVERYWVAGEPIPEIVEWLKGFYRPAKSRSKCKALLISRSQGAPVPLPGRRVTRMGSNTPVTLMRHFVNAPFRANRPAVPGLHPHKARKTFALFVVKRDKSALEALSYHYGHAYREFTDGAYIGSDMQLAQLLREEDRRELARALTDLLASNRLGGRGAMKISELQNSQNRTPQFAGKRTTEALVDRLISDGVYLAPCDWGYCVYSKSLSACHGDDQGPNQLNRTAEVCSGCANFVVTPSHLHWWNNRSKTDEEFLRRSDLPDQTRQLVMKRQERTKKILQDLVFSKKKAEV